MVNRRQPGESFLGKRREKSEAAHLPASATKPLCWQYAVCGSFPKPISISHCRTTLHLGLRRRATTSGLSNERIRRNKNLKGTASGPDGSASKDFFQQAKRPEEIICKAAIFLVVVQGVARVSRRLAKLAIAKTERKMMNATAAQTTTTVTAVAKQGRLMSLDALRGFDMFWIVGADALVEGLQKLSNGFLVQGAAHQLEHAEWRGFHFEDLIFPMFVFMSGVSLTFSLTRMIEKEGRPAAMARILRRAVLMYVLGVFYYGGFSDSFQHIRLLGVLQRIALAYLFSGLIFCYFRQRGQIIWCGALLIGYWLLLTFVPVPGGVAGNFNEGANLTNWLDKQYLPWRKWDGDHDPEGLLSTLPAIASCLLGVLAGNFLRDARKTDWYKVCGLALAGILLATTGWLWSLQFPVIKKIWTSSFVLVAGGYSCLFLAAFYLVIEIWQWRRWAQPFVWIGMNSITIYMIHNIVDVEKLTQRIAGGELNQVCFGRFGPLVLALLGLAITFLICRFLYRRGIFLRL